MKSNRFLVIIIFMSIMQRCLLAYNWPIESYSFQHQINGTFGEVRGDNIRHHMHSGIDIDRTDQNPNTKVFSVMDGVVVTIDQTIPSQQYIIIKHEIGGTWPQEYGYMTYMHVDNIVVDEEQVVYANSTVIGYINTVNSTHLHFVDGNYDDTAATLYDPLQFIMPFSDTIYPTISFLPLGLIENEDTTNFLNWPFTLTSGAVNDTFDILVKAYDAISGAGGSNNGISLIYITIYAPDTTFVRSFYEMDFFYVNGRSNWDVNIVYANGSRSTLSGVPAGEYIYKASNTLKADKYWIPSPTKGEGNYTIKVEIMDSYGNTTNFDTQVYITGNPAK